MAISLFFGLPGCGKTTLMVSYALKAAKGKRYKNVYCNVPISVPGVTYIDNDMIGQYNLRDCLILIDEATLFADNRAYKTFGKDKIQYFLLHRHYNADVFLFFFSSLLSFYTTMGRPGQENSCNYRSRVLHV